MGNENTARKMPRTVRHRKKLSDITNTPILQKSRAYDENDQLTKESAAQLRDELAHVKKMLAEKEEQIEEDKRFMDKLWINYCRKSKQNDEIILHNSQLYKDLTQARDKLKILEHENAQMSAFYKIFKSEMQQKLNEALEQVDHLTKLLEASRIEKTSADKHAPGDSDICKKRGLSCAAPGEDCTSIHGRKRQRKSYKEPSLKQKMRQLDGRAGVPIQDDKPSLKQTMRQLDGRAGEPIQDDNNAAVQKLGKAEECEAVSTSCRPEIKMSDNNAAVQKPGKTKECEAVSTSCRPEIKMSDNNAAVQKPGKTEECEAVSTSCRTEIKMIEGMACSNVVGENGARTEPLQQCTNVGKDQGVQSLNTLNVSTRKSCGRPLRRTASSIGSYKEPLLNTKMRRAA